MTDTITIKTDGEVLVNAMAMALNFSKTGVDNAAMRFMKGGILIGGMSKGNHSIVSVEIRANMMDEYNVKEELTIDLTNHEHDKIKNFIKSAKRGNTELEIRIDEEKEMVHMRINNLKGKFKYDTKEDYDCFKGMKAAVGWAKDLKLMGTIKTEAINELREYIKAAATWKGHGEKVVKFEKEGKRFELITEIEEGDVVVINMNKIITKACKESWRCMFQAEDINMMIKRGLKLTEELTIMGDSDHPIIFTAHGREPTEKPKFREDLDFWLVLAPRVEHD